MTQHQLAERASISVRGLQHLEAGETQPYRATLEALALALALTREDLASFGLAVAPSASTGETLGQALADLDARLFVGRKQELQAFRSWLAAGDLTAGIMHVWGPGGIGKSAMMRAFSRIAEAGGRSVVFVDGRDVRPDPDSLAAALGGTTLDDAMDRLNSSRAVVLLDTFDQLLDLTRVLQREVLPRLSRDVRLVIASRHH